MDAPNPRHRAPQCRLCHESCLTIPNASSHRLLSMQGVYRDCTPARLDRSAAGFAGHAPQLGQMVPLLGWIVSSPRAGRAIFRHFRTTFVLDILGPFSPAAPCLLGRAALMCEWPARRTASLATSDPASRRSGNPSNDPSAAERRAPARVAMTRRGLRPQPRRAAHPARIPVPVTDEGRIDGVGKHPRAPEARHVRVETIDVGKPSPQNDHVGV